MLSMMRRRSSTLVLAAVLAGCGDPSGPRPFSGTYVLAEIDGTGAPLVTSDHTFSNGERLVHSVVYDTIQFTSGTGARRSVSLQAVRFDATGTPMQANSESTTYSGQVQRDGNRLTITWLSFNGPNQQELDYVDGTLEWQTTVGLVCSDNCPGPRLATFTYARP